MSIAERFLMRAEECERLAVETPSPTVRELLLYFGTQWRELAAEEDNRLARTGAAPARKSLFFWWSQPSNQSDDR